MDSLRDAFARYIMNIGKGSTATPINPATGQAGVPQPYDVGLGASFRRLTGSPVSPVAPPSVNLAGPEGSVPRIAMDINEARKQLMQAIESGDDAKARQMEELIIRLQNPEVATIPEQPTNTGI